MTLDPPVSDADHLAGPTDPIVTVVQYGDFECPYSKDVHDILDETRRTHPGLLVAFRHFPLRPHPNALHAAVASEAAAQQGGFWLLHARMYAHQLRLRPDELAEHAEAVGLDGAAVLRAVREETGKAEVLAQKRAAVRAGVRTTLGLWIDGAWFDEDALEDAIIERVIQPLRAAGR